MVSEGSAVTGGIVFPESEALKTILFQDETEKGRERMRAWPGRKSGDGPKGSSGEDLSW
jgi:hypothetical protein